MTDQEQMDHWNSFHVSFGFDPGYKSLEEFRRLRRESREKALYSSNPMWVLEANLISEEDWWNPEVPS